MTGMAALVEANFLNAAENPVSVWTGALFAVVFLEELERVERAAVLDVLFLEEPVLEELPDLDLEVLAIISRYLLFP